MFSFAKFQAASMQAAKVRWGLAIATNEDDNAITRVSWEGGWVGVESADGMQNLAINFPGPIERRGLTL